MIAEAIRKALGQLGDPRFRRVLLLGVGLTVALLFGATLLFVWLVGWFVPDTVTLPWIGEIAWIDDAASWAVVPLMLVLSVFLMVPVASAFTGIFLDDVTDAVEARHYPELGPAPRVPFGTALRDSAGFLGVIVAANLVALVPYLLLAPLAPVIFLALNGYLLGREYFQLVAMRRLGRAGAKAARRRHAGKIWLAGAVMALPLTVPVANLLVPVIGAAAFTHLFLRLEGRRA
ncbi:MAG TPA: EI24 domain-containing protein [Thermoanaerobaculia bacterium]|nr:EI24 domain-containing protein [Thermoanaerobaculia bacterium]